MPQILKPSNLSLTWASGGDVLDPGNTKYATGWQVEIPPRQWFNYLDNRQDTAIAHFNQHGVPVWDAGTEYQADKSYTQGATSGTIYRCVQTHTNQNPETDVSNTYWIIAFASAGDFYTKAEVDGTFLAKTSNLADLPNTDAARTNLSVYSQAQTYTKAEVDGKTTISSTAQAQAGTSNATLITPLRLTEWSQSRVLGVSQTWQDVKASRAFNTTFTNTTGRPIMVLLTNNTGGTLDFLISGVNFSSSVDSSSVSVSTSYIVPNNTTYRVNSSESISSITWWELR